LLPVAGRDEIIAHLDELLDANTFADLGPNGLQVPGAGEVVKVVTAVSASAESIERAAAAGAQMLLVHHGLFWDFHPRSLTPVLTGRLRALLDGGLSLVAYHLPLDAHPELGNNALLAEGLGCDARERWGEYEGSPIGCVARYAGDGIPATELFSRARTLTGREPLVFDGGPERVRSLGIISGGAVSNFAAAIADGLDAYLTGEVSEWVMTDAREAGVHFISAGHYATETFGIRALGEVVADRFEVAHEFVDIPNPV
jgi:dinuclear metal center YbgI/SA1388 family protein